VGYIRHQVIAILACEDAEAIAAIDKLRDEMSGEEEVPNCIVGPVYGINGYTSFAFLPDGSKEGWESSDLADTYRERFVAAVQLSSYPSVATIQLGGDDRTTRVLFTTDEE